MGTEMTAFIEYDKSLWDRDHYVDGHLSPILPPFDPGSETVSLTHGEGKDGIHTGSKDYRFFGAIAGVRNETLIDRLYPPRGLPPNPSHQLVRAIEDGMFGDGFGFGTGWLFLREILASLDHQETGPDIISLECSIILDIMTVLERRVGEDRVRLVFSFD